MAAGPADTTSRSQSAALLRERLQHFADSLDELSAEQLAVIHDLTSLLDRLTASLDSTIDD